MPIYKNLTNAGNAGKDPGYKPMLYFAQTSEITTPAYPTSSPTAIGDKVKISTAHTFASGKGAHTWECATGSVKATFESQGDEGAQTLLHTGEATLVGDNEEILEQVIAMLNDNKIVWFKDADCLTNDKYVQFGDDCNPVLVTVSGDSGTNSATATGQKTCKITIKAKKKYFYNAALTLASA